MDKYRKGNVGNLTNSRFNRAFQYCVHSENILIYFSLMHKTTIIASASVVQR